MSESLELSSVPGRHRVGLEGGHVIVALVDLRSKRDSCLRHRTHPVCHLRRRGCWDFDDFVHRRLAGLAIAIDATLIERHGHG